MKNLSLKQLLNNKKALAIIAGITLLLVVGIIVAINRSSDIGTGEDERQLKKRTISEPVNIIDVEQRPYLYIAPNADGRNLTIAVVEVKKEAVDVDYELEYRSGSLLQGVFGNMSLTKLPITTTQLMGSCSAGGACTYHEDVTGGSLVTRFAGPENYALKTEWRYIENKSGSLAGSTDAKFQMESASLEKARVIIVGDSSGYPGELEYTLVSTPYFLRTTPTISGSASLALRANQTGDLLILGWDGSNWHEFEGEVDDKTITADVEIMELYLVVER
jgi:hypothetical protein